MSYSAKILADSISPLKHRLTTFEVCFPRLVLAEFNTHRMFSRNSASSRAIPVSKQLKKIMVDPFIPERFGINQAGMQSHEFHEGAKHDEAVRVWLKGRDRAVATAFELMLGESIFISVATANGGSLSDVTNDRFDHLINLLDPKYREEHLPDVEILNVHKQLANRVLEPYMWHTVIVTATEWGNYFALRVDKEAQPEIRRIAELMLELYESNEPTFVDFGSWHLPLVRPEEIKSKELPYDDWRKVSAGRCARVSYLTHDGVRAPYADIELHDRLSGNGHMSPLEHPARPMTPLEYENGPWSGNFHGWHQYRKDLPNESDFAKVKSALANR